MAKFTIGGKSFDSKNPYIKYRKEIAELGKEYGVTDALIACEIFRQGYEEPIPEEAMEEYLQFYLAMRKDNKFYENTKKLEEMGI